MGERVVFYQAALVGQERRKRGERFVESPCVKESLRPFVGDGHEQWVCWAKFNGDLPRTLQVLNKRFTCSS